MARTKTGQIIVSASLDETTNTALEAMMSQSDSSTSEIIRDCILIGFYLSNETNFLEIRRTAAELAANKHTPRTKNRMTPKERSVVDKYIEVYGGTRRMYYPPIMKALRAAAMRLDYETLCDIVEVSPNHDLIAMDLAKGKTPGLQQILSEKMIGMLLPLVDEVRADDFARQQLELEGTVKPLALNTLRELLDKNEFSVAYDLIEEATSAEQVARITKAATDKALDDLLDELALEKTDG